MAGYLDSLSALYGGGTKLINYPAPVGYEMTIPTDIWAWSALGNRAWNSNYGGQTQYNIYDGGYDPMTYYLAHNPQLMQKDPMLLSLNNSNEEVPIYIQVYADKFAKDIAGLETNLKSVIELEDLNENQKAQLKAKLEAVEDLKAKINNAISKCAPDTELLKLKSELSELADSIGKLVQGISQDVASQAAAAAEAAEDGTNPNQEEEASQENPTAATSSETALKDLAATVTSLIYDSIDGPGTKNNQLEDLFNNSELVNKDTIVAIFDDWKANYEDKEGALTDYIYDDHFWYDGGNKYIAKITECFEAKARELGIYSKVAQDLIKIKVELNATWNTDEGKIKELMNNLYTKVKAEMTDREAKVQAAKDKKAAEAKQAQDEKEMKEAMKAEEAQNQFLKDMRDIYHDQEAEISDDVKYVDGQFTVRIEGRNFFGEDFRELKKNIENASYDAEKYLKKQRLSAVA